MLECLSIPPAGAILVALLLFGVVAGLPQGSGATRIPPSETSAGENLVAGGLDAFAEEGRHLGPCPLEHTDVQAEIAGFVTRVRVRQTFSNPFEGPIEAIYTFPLSSDGAVDAMTIRAGDREIRGNVRRREEAREIYDEAKRSGRLAALLDEERPNVFTQSIANLMPGESVEVEIRYVESLDYADGQFEFSFPMVVGPRFVPGAAEGSRGTGWSPDTNRVPDASRVTPPVAPQGVRAGHDVSVSVELAAGLPIEALESRLHDVDVEEIDESHRRIRLRDHEEIPNRDFILRWRVAAEELASGVLVHRPDGKSDGYVTFLLVPPERVTPSEVAPREIVFVVDRSGSQRGAPLEQARAAILYAIDRLNPRDTFQVVSFGNQVEKLFERPHGASVSAKREARTYLESLEANGGTMMAEAVREVCAEPAPQNRLRIVSFMTDGYVGNDHEVIDLVRTLRGRSRWFPFGTGHSTNRYLLDHMAREGGGEVDYVLLDEDPEVSARRFYERIAAPVLTDVRIDFEGLEVTDLAPNRLSDVWAHKPLIVHARYRKPGNGRVVLRGFRQGEAWQRSLEVELPARSSHNRPIASMWARARVDELLARDLRGLQQETFAEALKEEVVSIALSHALLTPFTSFVAVEDRVVNEAGESRTVTVPVEVGGGVDREAIFGGAPLAAAPGLYRAGTTKRRMQAAGAFPLHDVAPTVADEASGGEEVSLPLSAVGGPHADKLGVRLAAFLEALPEGTVDVSVRVDLDGVVSPEVERQLEAAGLRIELVLDEGVVGAIGVDDLDALLAVALVDRVTLA